MGFSVNTNVDALNTYRNLNTVQNSLSSSLAKLSSGLRINNAGDDAAGLTIATKLGSQISGLTQASRNAQDGTSLVQTADGGLSQAQSLLGRLRDLAVQAANGSNDSTARTAITTEASSIKDELTRLSTSVNFNGQSLLNSNTAMTFQIGADSAVASNQISVDMSNANLTNVITSLNSQSSATWNLGTGGSAPAAGAYVFSTVGGTSVSTTLTTAQAANATTIAAALNDDGDFAKTFSAKTNADGTTLIVSAKSGAAMNVTPTANAGLTSAGAATTAAISFSDSASAAAAISTIDDQIAQISAARATFGAVENRFASAVSTISTSITNLTAAKSRITDVDMASEMVNYSRANILSQSGTAMLAQANALPQLALKLLQG